MRQLLAVILFLGVAVAPNLNAGTINFETDTVTTHPNDIEFTSSDGVIVTVSGWQAEFPSTTTTIPNVWGPFPTTPVASGSGRQIFGNFTRNANQGSIGLSVEPTGSLNPTETDTGTAVFQPLFDNSMRVGAGDEIQFALFEFSESVNVSQIIADTSVGTSDIWLAGGSGAVPDFSTDFLATLTSLGVTISLDSIGGPEFAHDLTGFNGVDFLLVGTTPSENTYGPLPSDGLSNFGFSRMTAVVPIAAAVDIQPSFLHPRHDGSGDTATSALLNDVIPVVVFGASTLVGDPEDLDTDLIDPATLVFGPGMGGTSPSHPPEFNLDVDSDGLDDARFRFLMGDAAFDKVACTDSSGTLVGELTTGENFEGSDSFNSDCNAQCH